MYFKHASYSPYVGGPVYNEQFVRVRHPLDACSMQVCRFNVGKAREKIGRVFDTRVYYRVSFECLRW
jgi:hypothetical protein